ncbi:IclR family transcriptional regulator [Saccharopolyspora griseoalba]|uniref:IclR family transcriptional regulator n=1 Tax=Saccharopolyspora griseoalba TaxID=1431848 RepID=A0ABW2LR87_9PSEU
MTADNLSSVQRAMDVLRALGSGPLRVQSVAEALGKEKTQVSRTLKVLSEGGFVERDPDTMEYRLGWQLFALAGGASDSRLLQQASPVLRDLVRALGEAAYLTVLSGGAAVTVLAERPGRALQANEWIGRPSPLHCTASGRALLMGMPDEEAEALLAAQPGQGTELAPRTAAEALRRLRAERAAGCGVAAEESEPGLVAVAAPVRDFRGEVIAAVNISAPAFRLQAADLDRAKALVADATARLSRSMGAEPAP